MAVRGNPSKLVRNEDRTPQERRKNATKAGLASGEARRKKAAERKSIQQECQAILDGTYKVGSRTVSGRELVSETLLKLYRKGNLGALDRLLKYAGEDPTSDMNKMGQKLLKELQDGKRTLQDTVLEMVRNNIPVPEAIHTMLKRTEPEPEDPTKGVYSTMSNEEMERLVAERRAKAKAQEEGVPERREEINELYKSMEGKDSFAPDAMPKAKED